MKPPDSAKKCKGCFYWRSVNGYSKEMCCYYMLDEGKCKKVDGDVCLSRKIGGRRKKSFDVPMQQRGM